MSTTDYQADLLAVLIASTATFQSVTGTATAAAAKKCIAIGDATDFGHDDADGQKPLRYPRAVITRSRKSRSLVGTATYAATGELLVLFEFRPPQEHATQNQQEAWFTAATDDIADEAWTLSVSRATPSGYSTSHLQIRNADMSDINYTHPRADDLPDDNEPDKQPLFDREWRVEY